jgi:hypothetical protein
VTEYELDLLSIFLEALEWTPQADLAAIVNAHCRPGPEAEVKRKVSTAGLSPHRKKPKLHAADKEEEEEGNDDLLDVLEEFEEKLLKAADDKTFSEESIKRLVAIRDKISALLPPQLQDPDS